MNFVQILKKTPGLKSAVHKTRAFAISLIPDMIRDRYHAWRGLRRRSKQKFDLKNPKALSQKVQWLKLYYRKPLYTQLADKYSVREYIKEKIGEEYLIPLIAVFESVAEIDFDQLPEKFVLKATHGCGWNVLCHGKSKLDREAVLKQLDHWLHTNLFDSSREWQYKNIKPRIVCEKLLETPDGKALYDYKIFCFNGTPKIIEVDVGRFERVTRNMYDTDWNLMPCQCSFPNVPFPLEKPEQLPKLLELATALSQEMPYGRIDFYVHEGRIYFGEITMHPGCGFMDWHPHEYDEIVGNMLVLPDKPWGR